ncbi:hypothetical protein JTE90_003311 [Oedothorax gibbosus]|uniref:Uncharacterized protein n=1 Tax=Oedothorax gibbosus TaxID=931172 RepID=A0AAV6TWM9_9ARAC|nr:hypothetical protein JTE90_003311 [Oedothorax gibbosus]
MKTFAVALLALVCLSAVMAGYPRSYYGGHGYKTYLGGAHYGYRPARVYSSHGHYAKPVVYSHGHYAKPAVYSHGHYAKPVVYHAKPVVHHAAPVVYSKPHVSYYAKPSYHHAAPVYAKPSYHLGGGYHGGHGVVYSKPISHGYVHRPVVYAKSYHH